MSLDPSAGLPPVVAIALVGALGVGSQWLAWRFRMPAIVLMLLAGLIVGPATGLFQPTRDLGDLTGPLIALAVAVILFEGGLTLNFAKLEGAAHGVRRLVVIGAPLGWLLSTLVLRWGAGLSWEAASVFGGILIVTGPTVIAPLLRQARLSRRPAALLQWEAIVNDPIGALAAVLAFEIVSVFRNAAGLAPAMGHLVLGIVLAAALGYFAGRGLVLAFRRGHVPEYMKVPVLFVVLLAIFAGADAVLHESGLLAVTVMGLVIANADLPSYAELRRFKEHATVLLVSGVFILLAASLDFGQLLALDLRAILFVALVVLVARPVTVLVSLAGTDIPFRERLLVALTGPRGVVLVAVAGLFGARLAALGVEDGALIGPLAFVLVAATVVLHGFTLVPMARLLGLAGKGVPGVLIVGGSRFAAALAEALDNAGIPVLVTDPNRLHLRPVRDRSLPTYFGDILSEAADHSVELASYGLVLAASDNDAYNTLVATDLAPEFGRDNVWQIGRAGGESARNNLPTTLGGRRFGDGATFDELSRRIGEGWRVRATRLTAEYRFDDWRAARPDSVLLGRIGPDGLVRFLASDATPGTASWGQILSLRPPETEPSQPAAEVPAPDEAAQGD
ncbi:MAG: sodium:proton antiporter [Paracoccaceae bacterium]